MCYKNAPTEQVFGKWMHFQTSLSLWELQVIRDWLWVRDIAETSLNRLFLFLILKNSHRCCSVEKSVLKKFYKKILELEFLFKKSAGLRTKICKIFKDTYFYEQLYLHVTLLTVHEKGTANDAWLKPSQRYMMEFFAKTASGS